MANVPNEIGSALEATEVDAASYIWANHIPAGRRAQQFTMWDVQAQFGTAANLEMVWASDSSGTSFWATSILNDNVNLKAGVLYGFTVMVRGSTFVNFQPDATVTVDLFYATERDIWY